MTKKDLSEDLKVLLGMSTIGDVLTSVVRAKQRNSKISREKKK